MALEYDLGARSTATKHTTEQLVVWFIIGFVLAAILRGALPAASQTDLGSPEATTEQTSASVH